VFEFAYTDTAPAPRAIVYGVDNQTVSTVATSAVSGFRGVAGIVIQTDSTAGTCRVFMGGWAQDVRAYAALVAALTTEVGDYTGGGGAEADVATGVTVAETDILALQVDALSAQYHISLGGICSWAADGGPMVAWVDGSVNGLELSGSEMQGYRFGPVGEDTSVISKTIALPADLNTAADLVVHIMGARVGAADTTMVLDVGVFFQTAAAAYDADADAGGATAAIGEATTLVTEKTVTVALADVPATPCLMTITIAPDAALDADDYIIGDVWLEGTRKLLTS